MKVDPENPELRERLKKLYQATGMNRELAQLALEDASRAADVAGKLMHLHFAGSLLMLPDGDLDEAIRVLEEAHALSPESIEGAVLLARAYAAAGRGDEGMAILDQIVQAHHGRRAKQLSVVYQEMSSIQLQEGFLNEALESLTKAFEMDVRNGQLAMRLGQLALDVGAEDIAVRAFRSVTMMRGAVDAEVSEGATAEAKAESHYHLAVIARKQGDARKAKILVSKALSENPDHEPARVLLAELD
jgi:tetratricopeptide (TPR) repeat protein